MSITRAVASGSARGALRALPAASSSSARSFASSARRLEEEKQPEKKQKRKSNRIYEKGTFNFNTSLNFVTDRDPDSANYRTVTAAEVAHYREPPTRVKMLVRDFIDDSLYNPQYGYFSKNVSIFTPPTESGFPFPTLRNEAAFQEAVAERYLEAYGPGTEGVGRQVWHTPTELFKPYYARALASAIVASYKKTDWPHNDLIIYEVGAGNGSFMLDALRWIQQEHPEIFRRTRYRIVEISTMLSKQQRARAEAAGFGEQVEVINEDFFAWGGGGPEPCFVVALEVFDNLAHDMIRYDMATLDPLQALVAIDAHGDYSLVYEPLADPLLRRVLAYRRLLPPSAATQPPLAKPLLASGTLRSVYANMPFAPNLSPTPDFVPTKAVAFLERLRDQLPAHRLLVADFSSLPDAVPGRNGPVVQTRYQDSMVPCETFLVQQGYFDIFFPTDFDLLRDTYSLIMNSPARGGAKGQPARPKGKKAAQALGDDFFTSRGVRGFRRRKVNVYSQAEFVREFGGDKVLAPTRTRDGLSPMLTMYENAKIMF